MTTTSAFILFFEMSSNPSLLRGCYMVVLF